jgi:hypothetical protein
LEGQYHGGRRVVTTIPARYVVHVDRKRRLPIVSSGDDTSGETVARAAWQWVGFGAIAIVVVWVPLAALAVSITARCTADGHGPDHLRHSTLALAASSAFALALAALAGGLLVGKWGGTVGGPLGAAAAGLVVGVVAVVASWVALGFEPGASIVAAISVAFAALGGKLARLRNDPRKR